MRLIYTLMFFSGLFYAAMLFLTYLYLRRTTTVLIAAIATLFETLIIGLIAISTYGNPTLSFTILRPFIIWLRTALGFVFILGGYALCRQIIQAYRNFNCEY